MKTLQNDFTTPEQSKRLLELGVPVDSADCYYFNWNKEGNLPQIFPRNKVKKHSFNDRIAIKNIDPCWSVGRLIAIYELCTSCLFERRNPKLSILEDVMSQISEDIIATDECWDFSKLEE